MEMIDALILWWCIYFLLAFLCFAVSPADDRGVVALGWLALIASVAIAVFLVFALSGETIAAMSRWSTVILTLTITAMVLRLAREIQGSVDLPPTMRKWSETFRGSSPLLVLSPLLVAGLGVALWTVLDGNLMHLGPLLVGCGLSASLLLCFLYLRVQATFDARQWLGRTDEAHIKFLVDGVNRLLDQSSESSRLAAVLLLSWFDVGTSGAALSRIDAELAPPGGGKNLTLVEGIDCSTLIPSAIAPSYEAYVASTSPDDYELFKASVWSALREARPAYLSDDVLSAWQRIEGRYYAGRLKRSLGFIVAFALFLFLHPVIMVIGWFLGRSYGEDQRFFVTYRIGRRMRPFPYSRFYAVGVDSVSGVQLKSRLGSFLLDTGLTSLPALSNVLMGEMALVGPGPLSLTTLDRLIEDESLEGGPTERSPTLARLAVAPALTGPAYAEARKDKHAQRCADYGAIDLEYVEHASLVGDILWAAGATATLLVRLPFAIQRALLGHRTSIPTGHRRSTVLMSPEITDLVAKESDEVLAAALIAADRFREAVIVGFDQVAPPASVA